MKDLRDQSRFRMRREELQDMGFYRWPRSTRVSQNYNSWTRGGEDCLTLTCTTNSQPKFWLVPKGRFDLGLTILATWGGLRRPEDPGGGYAFQRLRLGLADSSGCWDRLWRTSARCFENGGTDQPRKRQKQEVAKGTTFTPMLYAPGFL